MTQTPLTLQTVHDVVPECYNAGSVVVMQSAVRRAEKIVGRRLVQIAADEVAWDALTRNLVWAGHFRGRTPQAAERAWRDWVGKIRSAIKATRAHLAGPAAAPVVATDAAWARIAAHVAAVENTFDSEGQRVLPNMSSLSIANLRARLGHVAPPLIDTAIARAELARMARGKAERLRRSLAFFDRLIRARDAHPAIAHLLPAAPVGSTPTLRDAALDWNALDPGLRVAIDAAIGRAIRNRASREDRFGGRLGADPIAEGRASRHTRGKRIRKPDKAAKNFRAAVSWLIRHAWPVRAEAAGLRSLDDLMTPAVIERATEAYVARATADAALLAADATSTGRSMLARLVTIATRNEMDESVLWALEDCADRDDMAAPQDREMSATRLEFVRLLDADPSVARAILTAPRTLLVDVVRGIERWDDLGVSERIQVLKMGMAAAMLAIQIARPLRTFNVHEMTVDVDGAELRRPLKADGQAQIVIDRRRVKNRKDLEHAIPTQLWQIISYWLDELRPKWIEIHTDRGFTDNGQLFPGENGAVSRQCFNDIWRMAACRIGVPGLTPHMMRHVAATVYLAVHPGDYATVAALLRDTLKTVEQFYVRGDGRRAAELFAQTIALFNAEAGALIYRRAA